MKKLSGFHCLLLGCILGVAATSCHTAKRNVTPSREETTVTVPADDSEHAENTYDYLSRKLNVKVTSKDRRHLEFYEASARWIGTPYRYGGFSRKGIDCSGLVVKIYQSVYGKGLERSSAGILDTNCRRIKKSNLKPGDLVFFATGKSKRRVSHVGIFIKDGKFIHSSTSRGVIISDLDESYYRRTFVAAGEVR